MTSSEKMNQASAAVSNRRLLIRLLRSWGPLSRRQLADHSGLRSSSVTYITRNLLNRNLIHPLGKCSDQRPGKKQELLGINPDYGWVLGVSLERDSASLAYVDAAGGIINRDWIELGSDPELIPESLWTRVEAWLSREVRPREKLLGVGVGVPGIVDPRRGVVLRSIALAIENVELRSQMQQIFSVPVQIDNDANLAAFAESCVGSGENVQNFIYFLINASQDKDGYLINSLGATLMIGNQLYRGSHFSAGEIGRLIDRSGDTSITARDLLELAKRDGEFSPKFKCLVDRFSANFATLYNVFDPEMIVLGGNVQISNQRLIRELREAVQQRVVDVPGRVINIQPGKLLDQGVSIGGAISALEHAFYDRGLFQGEECDAPAVLAEAQGSQ